MQNRGGDTSVNKKIPRKYIYTRLLNHFISRVNVVCINPDCENSEKQLTDGHLNKYVKLETYYDYINLTRLEAISDPAMRDFYSTAKRQNVFSRDKKELFSVDYVAEINQKMPILKNSSHMIRSFIQKKR